MRSVFRSERVFVIPCLCQRALTYKGTACQRFGEPLSRHDKLFPIGFPFTAVCANFEQRQQTPQHCNCAAAATMSNRIERTQDKKSVERNQRILKDLLALPANKVCADCKKRGASVWGMAVTGGECRLTLESCPRQRHPASIDHTHTQTHAGRRPTSASSFACAARECIARSVYTSPRCDPSTSTRGSPSTWRWVFVCECVPRMRRTTNASYLEYVVPRMRDTTNAAFDRHRPHC